MYQCIKPVGDRDSNDDTTIIDLTVHQKPVSIIMVSTAHD